jgi:hypothetical protein
VGLVWVSLRDYDSPGNMNHFDTIYLADVKKTGKYECLDALSVDFPKYAEEKSPKG